MAGRGFGGRWSAGTLVLVGVLVLIGFNVIVSVLSIYVSSIEQATNTTPDSPWYFDTFKSFLDLLSSWLGRVLVTTFGVAVLIFLSFIYEALESEWR